MARRLLNEFDSVEVRDSYFPTYGTRSPEAEEAMRVVSFQKLLSFVGDRDASDWVVILE